MRFGLGIILYALWATGISGWFLSSAMYGASPFATNTIVARGPLTYGPGHK